MWTPSSILPCCSTRKNNLLPSPKLTINAKRCCFHPKNSTFSFINCANWNLVYSYHPSVSFRASVSESRNLRISLRLQVKSVRRSLDFARDDSVVGELKLRAKLKFSNCNCQLTIAKNTIYLYTEIKKILWKGVRHGRQDPLRQSAQRDRCCLH